MAFDRVRKGRNSVEEIVTEAIGRSVEAGTNDLKMHGCGREDIDVRMLGE